MTLQAGPPFEKPSSRIGLKPMLKNNLPQVSFDSKGGITLESFVRRADEDGPSEPRNLTGDSYLRVPGNSNTLA